jgi:spore maturation protein CgeB
MPHSVRLAYFAHAVRSDWNNGNAHFLRGLLRALGKIDGVGVRAFEPEQEWSIDNLRAERNGEESLRRFHEAYAELDVRPYAAADCDERDCYELWEERLRDVDLVVMHEWNPPELAAMLLELRARLGFRLLFHDTHHRASSSPAEMERFRLLQFDGVIAFGAALRRIYRERFGLKHVWVLHEAADVTVFHPHDDVEREDALVWVGNWGDGERSREICEFLLKPAAALRDRVQTTVHGVRYPQRGLETLTQAGVRYGGYLPNLAAPDLYARAGATVHVPRQQYNDALVGIPTIRVFEALACGVPLVSAPWEDTEELFREGDIAWARDAREMTDQLRFLFAEPEGAREQAERGRETVMTRHTCDHRARELMAICEEVLQ